MDEYILVAVLAIIVMLFFAVFVIRNVIRRINENSRKYFIDKLQDYDSLIDEKKEQLETLEKEINTIEDQKQIQKEIEEYKKNKEEIEKKIIENSNKQKETEEEIVYDIPTPKYRQEEFFSNYKKIKKQFNVNSKKILEEFIQKNKKNTKKNEYNQLIKIRENINEDTMYQIVTLSAKEQYDVINKTLTDKQKEITELNSYEPQNFSILKFMKNIDKKIKDTDPIIYVYVANEDINYDYMADNIKTLIYKNMSEGIIIQYQNKMYDYSI